MSFLLFLRGMLAVLAVFAVITYVMTQSLWATLVNTVICAILLQVGYFIAVLFLVWRGAKASGELRPQAPEAPPLKEEQPAAKVSHMRGAPPSR